MTVRPLPLPSKPRTLEDEVAEATKHGHQITDLTPESPTTPKQFTVNLALTDTERRSVRYAYVRTVAHLAQLVTWLESTKLFGFDIETNGLDPWKDGIATLQFGVLGHPSGIDAWVLDIRAFTREELAPVFAVLESRDHSKLGQNIRFEYRFLRAQYDLRIRKLADTQIAEMIIRAGLLSPKGDTARGGDRSAYRLCSMNALMKRYAKIEIDKDTDLRTSFFATPVGTHSVRQIIYAASDVIYPFVIAKAQRQLIDERGLQGIIKVEMELIPVLGELEHTGIRVDKAQWRVLWQEALGERAKAEAALDELIRPCTQQADLFDTDAVKARPIYPKAGRPLNYSSSEQVRWAIKAYCESKRWPIHVCIDAKEAKALKLKHGADWIKRQTEQGKVVDENDLPDWLLPDDKVCLLTEADKNTLVLRKSRAQLPAQIVDLLITYSKYDIRCDTFGNDWLLKNVSIKTGRVHTEVHQAVTNTGRVSTTPNLQNIPSDKRYRKCFVPAEGYKFVICDYSQQEPRLLAQVSKDPVYLGTYERNDDLYLAVAEAMLGHRPDKHTPEGKLERKIFKIIVLAMAYRAGARKLRDQLTLGMADDIALGRVEPPTLEYAREMHQRFFEVHEKVLEYQNKCSNGADPRGKDVARIWDDLVGDLVTYVRSPCGRIRFFPPGSLNTYTEASNAPIQGGSATMTKAAACLIQKMIEDEGWLGKATIVNLVHDEIVAEVHESIAEAFAPKMQALMVQAGRFYCPDVPIAAEYPEGSNGVVPYWAKEIDG